MHERTPGTSSWTSQHEFGRTQLDQVFAGKVETVAYHGAEPGKNADELVEKAIQIVEDNISETEFSVEELASSLNISRSYFYKKMIKITGKKPIEFIRTIRMKRAQQLLTESQMQVSEIAYTLGYNSPKVFSKHFKEEFNISPSEFIRQQAE